MVRGIEQARAAVRLPVEVGKLGVRAVQWGGSQVVGRAALRVLGMGRELGLGNEHIATRLEKTQPLSDAQLGVAEVQRGLREDDPELIGLGSRHTLQSVATAEQNPAVPESITEAVVDVAETSPIDLLAETSLVRPEVAEEARVVIGRFRGSDGQADSPSSSK